jgi:hypothetical protein
MNSRQQRMYGRWYQPKYSMTTADWIYCGSLLLASIISFGLGLIIGLVWALIL